MDHWLPAFVAKWSSAQLDWKPVLPPPLHSIPALKAHVALCFSRLSELDALVRAPETSSDTVPPVECEALKTEVTELMKVFQTPEFAVMRQFLRKRQKKKRWRETQRRNRLATRAQRETMAQEIDDRRAQIATRERAEIAERQIRAEAKRRIEAARATKAKAEQLMLLISKLQELRELRKNRLRRAGRMFVEDDAIFFERVRQSIAEQEAALHGMQTKVDDVTTENKQKEQDFLVQTAVNTHMNKMITWHDFFRYYDRANSDAPTLLQVRRAWDAFLVPPESPLLANCPPGFGRIPPGFINAPPPSSHIWATYLVSQNE
eukprot:gnl/Spiro4/16242_TR8723_c0_g2_i1.p1 gnl/Spiro4/16242_TR8723_c0_g2~~gnl/Spiro4/16242_TR8723_c0_g2_i1.p1  ORF type:complete len:319 (+),score=70.88 gnl/Spiro4/16242_TR8723_c0_g2_i1:97-1053(+)